jgi:hypothetical protein
MEMACFKMLSRLAFGKDRTGEGRKIAVGIVVEPAETRVRNHPDVNFFPLRL